MYLKSRTRGYMSCQTFKHGNIIRQPFLHSGNIGYSRICTPSLILVVNDNNTYSSWITLIILYIKAKIPPNHPNDANHDKRR